MIFPLGIPNTDWGKLFKLVVFLGQPRVWDYISIVPLWTRLTFIHIFPTPNLPGAKLTRKLSPRTPFIVECRYRTSSSFQPRGRTTNPIEFVVNYERPRMRMERAIPMVLPSDRGIIWLGSWFSNFITQEIRAVEQVLSLAIPFRQKARMW